MNDSSDRICPMCGMTKEVDTEEHCNLCRNNLYGDDIA